MRKSNYLWLLLVAVLLLPAQEMAAKKKKEKEVTDRELWAGVLYQMAAPVLSNMSEGKLQENMQVELSPTWDGRDKRVTYMECFGRLMAGLAPWLSLPGVGIEKLCAGGRPGKSGLPTLAERGTAAGRCRLCC